MPSSLYEYFLDCDVKILRTSPQSLFNCFRVPRRQQTDMRHKSR
jgi:hypothetical protein